MLLGFQRLMQSFRVTAARHHAAGEFVDDDDFAIAHNVILVALEQFMRAQSLVHVMHEGDIAGIIERALGQHPEFAQQFFHMLIAGIGEIRRALLLVEFEVLFREVRNGFVSRDIEVGPIVGRPRNDQRRARLIDENRIDLIDDRIMMTALNHLGEIVFHIVAEIVEAELIVGAIGDVGGVGAAAFVVFEAMHDGSGRQTEEIIDAAHPFGVAAGEIVVDGDDMHALAGERIEVASERRNKRLALASPHFGNRAFVQHHAADQLDVEVPLPEDAARRLPHRRESRDEQVLEAFAGGSGLAKGHRPPGEFGIGEFSHFGLERVDRRDFRPIALETAIVRGTENLFREGAKHYKTTFLDQDRSTLFLVTSACLTIPSHRTGSRVQLDCIRVIFDPSMCFRPDSHALRGASKLGVGPSSSHRNCCTWRIKTRIATSGRPKKIMEIRSSGYPPDR